MLRGHADPDEPDGWVQLPPLEAANHRPELFPDDCRSQDDLPQILDAEQTLVRQDLRPYRLGRCESDASAAERREPFPDVSPELLHHPKLPHHPDNPDVDAGRSVSSVLPEEEEEQDT